MFKNLLVPLDFSQNSLKLLRIARELALRCGARVHLLHVSEEEHDILLHTSADVKALFDDVHVKRDRWLDELVIELGEDGVDAVAAIVPGVASDAILAYAEANQVDLALMATLGMDPLPGVMIGTTTRRLLKAAPFPLLTLSRGYEEPDEIDLEGLLVTTDFSVASSAGFDFGLALRGILEARLRVLHVVKLPRVIPVAPGESPVSLPANLVEAIREKGVAQLAEAVERPEDEEPVEVDVATGADHAEVVNRYVSEHEIDLVIVPRVGENVAESLLFGRTAERIVKTCPRPVITLPPPGE